MITNFSKLALLKNLPIIVRDDQLNTFVFTMPSLEDERGSILNYNLFYGFCASSIQDLHEQTKAEFTSKYDFLIKAIKSGDENAISLLGCLSSHIQNFQYVDDSFKCGEFTITEEIFEQFCLYVAIASGCEEWSALETAEKEKEMSPEELEWERKKRLNQAKIDAAKQKAGKKLALEDIVVTLCYEYGMSLDAIYKMNKFGISLLYNDAQKIAEYELSKIAAGTGNLPKKQQHHYWTFKK